MKFIKIQDMFDAGGGATSYSSIISIDMLTRDDIFKAGGNVLLITEKMKNLLDSYARDKKTLDAEIYEQKVEYSLKHQIEVNANKDQVIKRKLIRLKLQEEDDIKSTNEFFIYKGSYYISDSLYTHLLGSGCRFKHVYFDKENLAMPVILHSDTVEKPIFAKDYDKEREVKMGFLAIIIAALIFSFVLKMSGVI